MLVRSEQEYVYANLLVKMNFFLAIFCVPSWVKSSKGCLQLTMFEISMTACRIIKALK